MAEKTKVKEESLFWQGWHSGLESLETRLSVLLGEIDKRTSAIDLMLDVQNVVKDLKKVQES